MRRPEVERDEDETEEAIAFFRDIGIKEDALRATLEIAGKIAGEMAEKGKSFKLNDGYVQSLKAAGVTEAQIARLLEGIEEYVDDRRDEARGNAVKDVEARIRAAVEAGEMTREEAAEKIEAMRKDNNLKNAEPKRGDVEAELEAYAREIRKMVAAGKMTETEAREKLEALRERTGADGR